MEKKFCKKQKIDTIIVEERNIVLKAKKFLYANNKYTNFSEEQKEAKREYGKNIYRNMKENKKII